MEAAHCRIPGPACRGSLLFPLSSLSSCALLRWGKPVREYRRDFRAQLPPFPRGAPAPYLSLPARASLRVFLLRAQGAGLFSPARAPALALEGRLGVHPTPWRRLSAQGDAIRRNGVAGGTPQSGGRLDALASSRRRRKNHGEYRTCGYGLGT